MNANIIGSLVIHSSTTQAPPQALLTIYYILGIGTDTEHAGIKEQMVLSFDEKLKAVTGTKLLIALQITENLVKIWDWIVFRCGTTGNVGLWD